MSRRKLPPGEFQWTPELAYAVGLIATDGCLSKSGRHIILRSSETEQLNNFKKCLKLTNKIGVSRHRTEGGRPYLSYRVQFGNVQLYRWFQLIGLTAAKTFTMPPFQIPDALFRDYLRGFLDGDGTITTYVDRYNATKNSAYQYYRLSVSFVSASEGHIKWIREVVGRLLGVDGDLWKRVSRNEKHHDIWQLKYMKKDSQKLIPWIYYNEQLPCLSRKRNKAETALKMIAGIARKKYTFQQIA